MTMPNIREIIRLHGRTLRDQKTARATVSPWGGVCLSSYEIHIHNGADISAALPQGICFSHGQPDDPRNTQ